MTTNQNPNFEPLFKNLQDEVKQEWGNAFDLLGPRVQRAILAEAVLRWANRQDEVVSSDKVRLVIEAGQRWAWKKTEES